LRTVGRLILAVSLVLLCCLSALPSSHRATSAADGAGMYDAASGVADAKSKIRTDDLPDWMQGTPWDERVYSHNPYEYALDPDDVAVTIRPIWLLEGLETPYGARDLYGELETRCSIVCLGELEVTIVADTPAYYKLDRIGIWLPEGFTYEEGSSNLENLDPSDPAYCVPVLQPFRDGTAVMWDYPWRVDFDSFPMKDANTISVTLNYVPVDESPLNAWAWCRTTRHDIYLSWSGEVKCFHITSEGPDPFTGEPTTMEAYALKNDAIGSGSVIYGDYVATGNTLMRDQDGDAMYRERLYKESPADMTTVPPDATPRKILLYWSGWKATPSNVWYESDPDVANWSAAHRQELLDLVPSFKVNEVSLKVEVDGTEFVVPEPVAADSWQVLPGGSPSLPDGWSYSCKADITDLVTAYFSGIGVDFNGNGTYTVGHAEAAAAAPSAQNIRGVWGSSASDVFMVGDSGTIAHFDGTSWSTMTSGTTQTLYGVWGSAANNVFAVGASGTIRHFDGNSWSTMASGTTQTLYGVWGSAADNLFVVGSGATIRRFDGTSWSTILNGTATFYGVWGNSASNVFVVGSGGLIVHFNGTSWSTTISGAATFYGVWGSSVSDVFAVGSSGAIAHFNGASWSPMDSGTTQTLYGVWGSAANDVFAVGANGTILQYNGTSWHAWYGGSTQHLYGTWGTSGTNAYAVGYAGTILHYNGSGWLCAFPLYGWVNGHSGETAAALTDYRLGDNTPTNEWAYAAWSVLVVYNSARAHQFYLEDTLRSPPANSALNMEVTGLLGLPHPEARLTCFVGEGDAAYTGDNIYLNGVRLNNGASGTPLTANNVWNGVSSNGGTIGYPPDNTDLDTFSVDGSSGIIQPGDTAATIRLVTQTDRWDLIYMVLSVSAELNITASAGANGTITPSGEVSVGYGSSQAFVIIPDAGFCVDDVLVDGASVGAVDSFVFTDVTGDHTITAAFAPDQLAVTAVTPNQGNIGETLEVTISGRRFTGATGLSLGSGVTVNSFVVESPRQITASITIDSAASLGARDVCVATPEGTGVKMAGFTVATDVVVFPDANLETAVREEIRKPTGDILQSDLDSLTVLWANERSITDLAGLEYCTNLVELYLSYNQIYSVGPLSGISSLTVLYLSGNQIVNIEPLSGLTLLTSLDLGHNQISDLAPLTSLTGLQYLGLYGNQISDLTPLTSLTSLTFLYLGYNGISDISLLSGLTGLSYLELSSNQISDISPLSGLTSLSWLMLSGNQISDISPVSGLTGLTNLQFHSNQIADISPVSGLGSLTWLDLSSNQIVDISPISGLGNLTNLVLSYNQISDISPLSSLTSLKSLYLFDNQIGDISPVSGLTSLTELYLSGNEIGDISPLSGLTSLTTLYLRSNQISDIEPLVTNPGLASGDSVDLRSNPLNTTSVNTWIPALEARGVVVSWDTVNHIPSEPTNVSPANGTTGVTLTPVLQSSAFSDPDFGDAHTASQWQITATSGDYSGPVFDSGPDAASLTSVYVPSGVLEYSTTYYWRVRHQDNRRDWSEWSAETSFTAVAAPQADFSADKTSAVVGQSIQFTDLSSGGVAPLTYQWDFNNDGTWDSTEQSPSYTYGIAGTYTVVLSITDSAFNTDTETKTSYVTVAPAAPNSWYEQFTTGDSAASGVYSGSWASQSFTPVTSHTLNAVSLKLYKVGSPTYTVTISLYAAGSDNKPTGSVLASSTFLASSLTTTASWYTFEFSTGYGVAAGTRYALVLSATDGAAGNLVYWRVNTAGTYGRGMKALSANQGASWTTGSAQDLMFKEGQNPPMWYEQFATGDSAASGVYGGCWASQSFAPVTTHTLSLVSLRLYKVGSPTYTVTIGLYAAGSDNKPTGSALASTTFPVSSLTTTATWYTFEFSTGHEVTAGTKYALVLSATEGATGNLVYWRVNTAGTYSRGMKVLSANQGTSWTASSAQDFMFKEGAHL
jgi:internalin A